MEYLNSYYNGTFNISHRPLIGFPDQTVYVHRQIVFLKCFTVALLENKHMGRTPVQRLKTQLMAILLAISCTLSSELVWKSLPIMLFCYAFQTLKLFTFEINSSRFISYTAHVLCCLQVPGFEFVYDAYLIFCFLGLALWLLSVKKDHEGNEMLVLLVFVIEIGLIYLSHATDCRISIFVSILMMLNATVVAGKELVSVAMMYSTMSQFLTLIHLSGYDVDDVWHYLMQFSGIS